MISSHMIFGRKYRVKDVPAPDGFCTSPKHKGSQIAIPIEGDTLGELTVILHEALHAALWVLDEDTIDQVAYDQARLLWRLGWRKEEGQ